MIAKINDRQKTTIPSIKQVSRKWYFLDLKSQKIGRIAPQITNILRGKNQNNFVQNLDWGNFIVLTNAKFIKFTGGNRKLENKYYYTHSGYPGGLHKKRLKDMIEKSPQKLVSLIIKGMMPKNKLSKKQMCRLFVFSENHNLLAQQKSFTNISLN